MDIEDTLSLKKYAQDVNRDSAHQSFLDGLRVTQDPEVDITSELFKYDVQFSKDLLSAEHE